MVPAMKVGGLARRTPESRLVGVTVPVTKLGGLENKTPETVTPPGVTVPAINVGGAAKTTPLTTRLIWPVGKVGGRANRFPTMV